ncbi:fimbrial protein [Pseudomonas sp. TWR3-1-1]|uniref:fimbrial protein n=1 Tax=Pseudomonas sp. TWR3-1-1 TaxID=2804633 RepID=UPI003CEDE76F
MNVLSRVLAVLLASALPLACLAVDMRMDFGGNMMAAPPCVINDGKLIAATFGDVQVDDIDGSYKTITLPYTLDCSLAVSNQVRIQVQGAGTWFLPALLAVPGNDELGIAFKKDGSALALNTWANFDASKKPLLQAVLAKRTQSSDIVNGTFSATATVMVEYQ